MIVDSEGLHHRAYDAALDSLGFEAIPFEVYAEHFTSRGEGLDYSARRFGVEPRELHRKKQEIYRDLLREARLCPSAAESIEVLAGRFPLAVATNSPRGEARTLLERFGLERYFRALVGREDYARPKPAGDAFLTAAARLGSEASRCLVVEDAPKGLDAALACGARCVIVPNAYTRLGPFDGAVAVLQSLAELTPERAAALVRV